MTPQQTLESCIEEMGVWISRHPSGALRLGQGAESMMIFSGETTWKFKIMAFGETNPYVSGEFPKDDIQKFVHMIQKWSWQNAI